MDLREVCCGEMGENRDWKIVVVSDSRCFGTPFESAESDAGVLKLFMTSYRKVSFVRTRTTMIIPRET